MSTSSQHLGERQFDESPMCIDAEVVVTERYAPGLALWLSAAFAAAAIALLLILR